MVTLEKNPGLKNQISKYLIESFTCYCYDIKRLNYYISVTCATYKGPNLKHCFLILLNEEDTQDGILFFYIFLGF